MKFLKKPAIGLLSAAALATGAILHSATFAETRGQVIPRDVLAQANDGITSDTTLTGSINLTEGGTYTLTGAIADGQLVVDAGDDDVTLVLNGVDITNSSGAAIHIVSAGKVTVELADGSVNRLTQGGFDGEEKQKAALASKGDLEITGSGTLHVASTVSDGISAKGDLRLTSGNITVIAADDGILGKNSVTIAGGNIEIDARDDGIKSTNDKDLGQGMLTMLGGHLRVLAGDDGVKAEQAITIDGGVIEIPNSVEGIEAPVIIINAGDITIYSTDDGINASASDIITDDLTITINGGNLDIEVGPGDTDAIDSNGSIYVNGGTIDITAPFSSFDFDITGELNGGTVTVNEEAITEMPKQMWQ